MRLLWLAVVAMLIAACTTMPVPSSSAKPVPPYRIYADAFTKAGPGSGFLVVTRDTGWQARACAAHLYVDGTLVANLQAGEQVRLFLPDGEHLIGVTTAKGGLCRKGSDQLSVETTQAEPLLLRIAGERGRSITIKPSAF
jgi:hypothetical protein